MLGQTISKNIILINYSNNKYEKIRSAQTNLLRQMGFNVSEYSEDSLSQEFKTKNRNILSQEIGAGYWIWKPYIILDELKKNEEDKIIFYLDAGDIVDRGLSAYLEEHFEYYDYILYEGDRPNKHYTKPEVFKELNLGDEYKDAIQLEAGICGFRKTDKNIKFLEEWLSLCQNENLILDARYDNTLGDNGFIEHRRDQSLLTILKIKHNLGAIPLSNRLFIDCNKEELLKRLA